ncbi:PHD finger protein 20 isoform X1 [Coregonus clupeaformis]|uniref:PHD finger protein 20 isoform X1 n=1 Tax=Coregonus clupeaformis TaxID=59861 RepID=UPI001E1C450E|nr:PHD finger protein 20 isoform X1 [Coregonus clupeaformis]XP_041702202.2 PHD finger protein 20 isoform X1 [Coregonus clupeaformis]
MMTKTPPNRRGITFEVGAQLEARDSLKNWYQASIEKIDYEEEKVLIHYRQWSHRYDEWFDWTSPYLRPLERIQLRREGLQDKRPSPVFRVNEKVLACWVDCRYYPAKVLEVKRDASYTVKFFDGVVKTLKPTKVKPYKKENGKARERDRTQSEQSGGKDKAKENGKAVSDESKNGSSDLDGERNGEEEERREDGEEKTLNGNVETSGQKGNLNGEEGEKGAGGGQREEPQAKENGQVVQTKREEVNVEGERVMRSTQQQGEKKEEGASGQSPQLPRGNRYRPSEESQRELRKRRVSLGQMPPPKRRRPDTSKDRNSQSQKQAGSDSIPESPALTPDQTNTQTPTDAGIEAPSDIGQGDGDEYDKSILKCQVHLPTTHKYSREPLYRVIKNQPPPILSIELDHNPFKCKAPGCLKSFRKASLLHYHVKYYHADSEHASGGSMQTRASEKQAGSQETPRKRRTMSGSIHSPLGDRQAANGMNCHRRRSLSEKRKENQHTNSRPHEEREWGASETGEKIREKTERDFLNKQKKRKKKGRSKSENTNGEENIGISLFNSTQSNPNLVSKFPLSHKHKLSYDSSPEHITDQVQEDDESDWSTVSAEWSDEYMEAELDVTTPMSEQNVSMVTKGSDIVRCVCEVEEENDFMIQCDECLCWQHGTCMGLFEHNVPDTYNCYICRDPPVQRQSQRYWYDRDWLSSGHMYGLSFLDENYSHQNGKKITATHQLLGDVHQVFEVLNGLQLKMSILQTQTHSDLKLWRQPWKQEEELGRSCSMATCRAPSPAANDRGEGGEALRATSVSAPSEKLKRVQMSPTSFQDSNASYISSEHCYQKPRAYYPAVEQRLVVETRGGSELEDSLRSTENLLEQCYGGPLDPDRAKLYPSSLLQDRAKIHPIALQPDKGLDLYKKLYVGMESEVEMRTEEAEPSTDIKPDPEKDNVLQWQINLLDHIEAMQNQVTHRMDLIEKELDVLESWLDYTGELEPPDPLTRLPQLKHRIRQMLTDLGTVQQISLCSSKT